MVISAKTVIRLLGTNLSQKAEEEGRTSDQPFYIETLQGEMEAGAGQVCSGKVAPLHSVPSPLRDIPTRPCALQTRPSPRGAGLGAVAHPVSNGHPRPQLGGGGMELEPVLPPAACGGGQRARPGL